jgi:putative phage-type endonuclease
MSKQKRPAAIKLYHTKDMSEEQWREHRHEGIGGSDVSAILGINKWRTPMQVYMEKTKQWEPDDLSDNQAVYWGHRLESLVADEFQKRTGYKVQNNNYILQHAEHTFMRANIDREIITLEGRGVLECKTTSEWNRDEWKDSEVPQAYMVQVQHYLAVTGYDFAYIAVLIGGNKYDHWRIERDDELIEIIIEAEKTFWEQHIQAGTPPEINYSIDGAAILDKLYPGGGEETVTLSNERATQLLEQIKANQMEMKLLKEQEETWKNELKDFLEDNETATHELAKITWKAPKPREVINDKKLKENFPEIYEEVKELKQNKRTFRITYKKEQ